MGTCLRPNLSIVIPIYNAEAFLHECIKSIITINRTDIEILLIDDGSTDASYSICTQYALSDNRIHVFHKDNGGVSSARNFGIRNANGNWVTFVDADDQVTREFLLYYPSYDVDLVCFNWMYSTGEKEELLPNGFYDGDRKKDFLNRCLVNYIFRTPWAKFFKRELILKNQLFFNERFKVGEDNLFMLDYLAVCDKIVGNAQIGYIYLRPAKGKYNLSLKESADFMTEFMTKYERLHVDCQPLLLLLELFYYMAIDNDTFSTRMEWEKTNSICKLQDLCWSHYGKREKIGILFRRFLINVIFHGQKE